MRLHSDRWREVDSWEDCDDYSDTFEVIERLDVDPHDDIVHGKPEDYGLQQKALFAA